MDWWKELETNWDDIVYLVHQFHPYYQRKHSLRPIQGLDFEELKYPITAPAAETACEVVRNKIRSEALNDPVEAMKEARIVKDGDTIWSILNQTWFGLPESTEVRYLPGFHILCDLCSEYEA